MQSASPQLCLICLHLSKHKLCKSMYWYIIISIICRNCLKDESKRRKVLETTSNTFNYAFYIRHDVHVYSGPTYSGPTYSGPTYSGPTYSEPTCSRPTCSRPTRSGPICSGPTCLLESLFCLLIHVTNFPRLVSVYIYIHTYQCLLGQRRALRFLPLPGWCLSSFFFWNILFFFFALGHVSSGKFSPAIIEL